MTDHTGRQAKKTTVRARQAAAEDSTLSRSTGFKPRPRLTRDQTGMPHGARLVHRVRVQQNWTQERLGAELGVTRSTVARWEAGRFKPPLLYEATLEKLLKAS